MKLLGESTSKSVIGTTTSNPSGIARDVNSIELTREIIELQGKLLDVQRTMAELQDQNFNLREELRPSSAGGEGTVESYDGTEA
jgi:hypothetical protein